MIPRLLLLFCLALHGRDPVAWQEWNADTLARTLLPPVLERAPFDHPRALAVLEAR